jgi:hypothetical protein
MDTDAPPVSFTLRPHHLNLLVMITLLFKHFDRLLFNPVFLLRVHEITIVQISEVSVVFMPASTSFTLALDCPTEDSFRNHGRS